MIEGLSVKKIGHVLQDQSGLYEIAREMERTGFRRVDGPRFDLEERMAGHDSPALADRELSRLPDEARANDDVEIRRLVRHHAVLREAADRLLKRVRAVGDDLVRVAEHFVHADRKRAPAE